GQRHADARQARFKAPDRLLDAAAQLLALLRIVERTGGEIRNAVADRRHLQLTVAGRPRTPAPPRVQQRFEVAAHAAAQNGGGFGGRKRRIAHHVGRIVDEAVEQRELGPSLPLGAATRRTAVHDAKRRVASSMIDWASSPIRNTRWPMPRTGPVSSSTHSV